MTVNLNIISVSSHTTKCLLYVVDARWELSCFVTYRRKQIFFMTLSACSQHDLVSVSDGVQWRYTAQAVPVIWSRQFYRTRYLWITCSEADICVPAADRIQTAARLYWKKLKTCCVCVAAFWVCLQML